MVKAALKMQEWEKADFIREDEINRLLEEAKNTGKAEVAAIIEKARQAQGLTLREVAVLLQTDDEGCSEMFAAAGK